MYDIVIIGAGVIGCAVARELSKYELKVCVVEKEADICCGTSKANSGIVHSGFDAIPGTWKAKMNCKGNQMMAALSEDLDFPFRRNGSFVICFEEEEIPKLMDLKTQGEQNGVQGLRILLKEELLSMAPGLSDQCVAALYAPTGGIVCPFGLTIALAENAFVNGVEFCLNTTVLNIIKLENGYQIETSDKMLESHMIINAAGVYGDVFHNQVSKSKLKITPRKGEYCLFDKAAGVPVDQTVFQMPSKLGKGILVTPTIHGNLLIGPTATDIEDKAGVNTTAAGLEEIIYKARRSVKELPVRQVITSFAGIRAHEQSEDFIIGEPEDAPGFIDVAGIASPGLSSAPAIGEYVGEMVAEKLAPDKKEGFIQKRKGIKTTADMTFSERTEWISQHPEYGTIVCRCEKISEGEILDAIHRPLGAVTLDGVKRRTRAGMGRCQSGFCMPKIMDILSRELKLDLTDLKKSGVDSEMLIGKNKCNDQEGGDSDGKL